jgi:voltage-gated sodium channel
MTTPNHSSRPVQPSAAAAADPLARLVASRGFSRFILAVIIINAVLIGWETYIAPPPAAPPRWLALGLSACLWIFVVELALKIADAARRGRLREFFTDGWNIFDIVVVGGSFIPAVGSMGPILRVIRVLRVFRLVRGIPELRLIVTVLLRSIVSMKYITLLAAVIFYIYAVVGVQLFNQHLPEYTTLHEALFTLFRVLTGDNWTDLRYGIAKAVEGTEHAALAWKATMYHVSWMIVSTFLLINLIVGAVLNNYQQVQEIEHTRKAVESGELDVSEARIRELVRELDQILKVRAAAAAAEPARPADRPPT